jgi:glycine cleavage system aminomethyltransferase T
VSIYGQDLDDSTSLVEAGLDWAVGKEQGTYGDFPRRRGNSGAVETC